MCIGSLKYYFEQGKNSSSNSQGLTVTANTIINITANKHITLSHPV